MCLSYFHSTLCFFAGYHQERERAEKEAALIARNKANREAAEALKRKEVEEYRKRQAAMEERKSKFTAPKPAPKAKKVYSFGLFSECDKHVIQWYRL